MSEKASYGPRSASHAKGRQKKPPQKPRKPARWGRRIFFSLLIVLVGVALYLGYLVTQTRDALEVIGDPTIVEVPPEQSVKVKGVTFLLLGLDSREKGGGLNTDVIKIVSMNPNTKSATVVSVPRDALIEMDGYISHKANAYYAKFYMQAIGDKQSPDDARAYARSEMREMFGQYFDIPIDYTAVINFDGFRDVVDALDGVTVDVDMDMCYIDNADGTNIQLTAGTQQLDGKQALDYVRYRQSSSKCSPRTKESSDFERNKRQTQVIQAVMDEVTSLGVVTRVDGLLGAVGSNLKVDMPPKEIERLMTTYFGIGGSDIESVPLEGTWRSPYVRLDAETVEQARAALQRKLAE
ncbi:LCP family protein [Paenibacillus sp. IB182496]|uniref:LCP family protein n=1 Tax=Paenibacillus sabuli TaxID=2772509 RepID=A0A927BRM1_9BACL|nr:LCP family protein [Paenibacillus sabuli]MBD2844420.1 LCP family protein [Paenibacillus sabuli]